MEEILEKCYKYTKCGEVARYIPELAKADINEFGICVYICDETKYEIVNSNNTGCDCQEGYHFEKASNGCKKTCEKGYYYENNNCHRCSETFEKHCKQCNKTNCIECEETNKILANLY